MLLKLEKVNVTFNWDQIIAFELPDGKSFQWYVTNTTQDKSSTEPCVAFCDRMIV